MKCGYTEANRAEKIALNLLEKILKLNIYITKTVEVDIRISKINELNLLPEIAVNNG